VGGCAGVWQPVTITVSGIFENRPLEWSAEESNEGCASISHGHLFQLFGPPVIDPPVDPPAPAA
jgi:hypothetical protein